MMSSEKAPLYLAQSILEANIDTMQWIILPDFFEPFLPELEAIYSEDEYLSLDKKYMSDLDAYAYRVVSVESVE